MSKYIYTKGTPVTLTATASEGYEVRQLYINNEPVPNPITINLEVDTQVRCSTYTLYRINVTTTPGVTATINGLPWTEGMQLRSGSEVVLNATLEDGYILQNATVNSEQVELPYTFTLQNDTSISLNAVEELTVNITSDANTIVTVNGQSGTSFKFASGTSVAIVATAKDGYTLSTFTLNGLDIESPHTFVLIANATINAASLQNFTLNLTADEHASVAVNGQSGTSFNFVSGDEVTIVVTPDTGYNLATFTVNGSAVTSPHEFTISQDTTVVVTTAIQTFTISTNDDPNATTTVTF